MIALGFIGALVGAVIVGLELSRPRVDVVSVLAGAVVVAGGLLALYASTL